MPMKQLETRCQMYLDAGLPLPLDLQVELQGQGFIVDEFVESLDDSDYYHPPINLYYFQDQDAHGRY